MSLTERQYVIRVSALLDRSTAAATGDAVQQVERQRRTAADRTARDYQRTQEAAQRYVAGIKDRYFRDEQRRQEKEERDRVRSIERFAREEERQGARERRQKEATAAAAVRVQERAQEHVARIKDRHLRDEQRREEHAQAYVARIKERHFREEQRRSEQADRRAARERSERAESVKRVAADAYGTASAIGRRALGVGGDIASGLGLDFSVSRGVSKAVQLEDLAVAITNAGNRGTGGAQGAAARAAQPAELQALAKGIGNKYAFDPTQVLQGLSQYQALTGDLDTGKAGLEEQAALAKGFNVELSKMIAAAGQIGSAIGEVGEGKDFATAEEKAKAVNDVLRTMTAQGQEGAIEIANLATQMAKLKAAGGRFEGSTAESIKRMGALAQLSMQLGGSASATQAATSVMGFANTLATPARRAQFKEAGVDIDSTTQKGAFADPFEIIRRSLQATGGDQEKMKKLFANVVGERAVMALTGSYNKAGGGDQGIAAVNEQFKRFGGTITDAQLGENVARAKGTMGSRMTADQNQIDEIYADMVKDLAPALKDIIPIARDVTKAFAGVVSWAANNPGSAITAAIVASIGKAAIGKAASDALANAIKGGGGGAGGPGAGGPGMGLLGNLGAGLAIATVAIATAKIGMAVIDDLFKDAEDAEKRRMEGDLSRDDAMSILRGAEKTGVVQAADKERLEKTAADLQRRIALAKDEQGQLIGGTVGAVLRAGENYVTGGPDMATMRSAQQDIPQIKAMEAELAKVQSGLADIKSGTLKITGEVTVKNMPAGGPAPSGRTGIDD